MYAIRSGGKTVGYSDGIVYIRLHENGSYVPCSAEDAEGFCTKIAVDRTDEETGETTTYLEDSVYAFAEGGLHGTEPAGTAEDVSSGFLLTKSEKATENLDTRQTASESAQSDADALAVDHELRLSMLELGLTE